MRSVRGAVISMAGLVGSRVRNQADDEVGRLVDVVARLYGDDQYPPVTGLVVRVGQRRAFLDASSIASIEHGGVVLRAARMDLREFARRPGEVLLARDVLDHQLVDVDGVQVIRAADLYLAPLSEQVRLVGVDVSVQSLLRRLGPKRWRHRPTPDRVIDWAAIAPFAEQSADGPATVHLVRSREALHRLRPGELADLLEDLGRPARQQMLASLKSETAADALEEMEPDQLEQLLRESEPERAAELVTAMEPDEAVDALRELPEAERDELLEYMTDVTRQSLSELVTYPRDEAAGFMTTHLITGAHTETVDSLRARLRAQHQHQHPDDVDAVVVLNDDGGLVGDLPLFELIVASGEATLGRLLVRPDSSGEDHTHDGEVPEPVVVGPGAGVGEVADALVDSRRSSILVVDDTKVLGRILADDVLDALQPEGGRRRSRRMLW